jgi:drug/metabolite transporter (DMT)-like permease
MGLAMFVVSLLSALAKFAASSVPVTEVVFVRSFVSTIVLVIIHFAQKNPKGPLLGNNRPLLSLRGIFGSAAVFLYFFSLSKIPVADAILLFQLAPVFVLILAAVLLKEKVHRMQILMLPLAVFGVALVLQPELKVLNFAGLAAIGAAGFTSGAHLCIKKLVDEDANTVVLYFAGFSSISVLPFMFFEFVMPDMVTFLAMLAIGILAVLAQLLVTTAYRFDSAGRVVMALYLGVVFSGIWDWLFWSHLPTGITVIGAVLIVSSLIGLHFFGIQFKREE